jgi:5'-methylthioadenosine phosphorylase
MRLEKKIIAFLPRHGARHSIPPHRIPYKANLVALKKIGIRHVIATCITGSLSRNIRPGDFVVLDQFVNLTWGRDDYFDIDRNLIHLPMNKPYCKSLRKVAYKCAKRLGIRVHDRGTVLVIQGPHFSTEAESKWFSRQGWDVVNMTQYPECYFAREMGLCYTAIAMVTDYDVGIKSNVQINIGGIGKVIRIFDRNVEKVKKLLFKIIEELPSEINCDCSKNLADEYYKRSLKLNAR